MTLSEPSNEPRCMWVHPQTGEACAFEGLATQKMEGRRCCFAHWPAGDGFKSEGKINEFFEQRRLNKNFDVSTFVFPAFDNQQHVLRIDSLVLSRCSGLGAVKLSCNHGSAIMRESSFQGKVEIGKAFGTLDLTSAVFKSDLRITCSSSANLNLRHGDYLGRVTIWGEGPADRPAERFSGLDCRSANFSVVPTLVRCKLPQQSTFYGAVFRNRAAAYTSEGAHRALRVAFAENSDREMEGFFYKWEKRCHRQSLNWRRSWFARSVSYLYDRTSNYGLSFELALLWLLGVQLLFGYCYAWASYEDNCEGPTLATVAAFTVAQVVRPFELYSARAQLTNLYRSFFTTDEISTGWLFATTFHSILSLTLFALIILAIRWRYRRD